MKERLDLPAGEWWENPEWGNGILRMLQESGITEANAQSLSVYLTEYVRDTKGVQDVTDIRFSVEKARFSWSCTVLTEYGKAAVRYETGGG